MTTKAEQKEQTHESILASASRLLREKGIAGARVADVMKGAGLTVGGFYAHFASKEDLVDDTLRRTGKAMRERIFAKIEEKPAEDRTVVILKRYLSAAHRDAEGVGCPFPAVVGEVGTSAPEHGKVVSEQVDKFAKGIGDTLPKKTALPARTLAIGLAALMVGGLSIARAARGTPLSDEVIKSCRALGEFAVHGRRPKDAKED